MATTDVRKEVRSRYAKVASQEGACCGTAPSSCGTKETDTSKQVGYTDDDLASLPEGANLGLGCGNPVALASLEEGDVVVDLGSGGGIDCFLAAKRVGESGRVIGVDMTPEMIEKARANAESGGYTNVEFRLGEIEALPVADNTANAIISNCVINLSPEKGRVFAEAFRVLKPGGACFISDIVLEKPLPESIRSSAAAYSACVSGAMLRSDYLDTIRGAGFDEIEILGETTFPLDALTGDPNVESLMSELKDLPQDEIADAAKSLTSLKVKAVKPGAAACCGG